MAQQEGGMHGNGESMATVAVHGGERRPGPEGSVVFPIYQGTVTGHAADLGWSFSFVDAGRPETWEAARTERTKVFSSIRSPTR
jgi:O-acetylhomoserine/O-acetylserine sulfhydrylase-like pyridoxal-dependent enzyme